MASDSSMQARSFNKPFWFLHIEGFPQVWFTEIPVNWDVPVDMEYLPGLMILPTQGAELGHDIDPMSGIEDPATLSLRVIDETFFAIVNGTARSDNGFDGACLVTNNIAAGSDANIVVAKAIPGAPASNGTLYLGNQTISYATKSGTTFSGISRGRHHSLSDTDLTEQTFKSAIEWNENLDVAPLITLTPRTILGRVATLYRCYFIDDQDGYALIKGYQTIRFRGQITAYGDPEDHLGTDISIESIVGLLDQDVFFPKEVELFGFDLPCRTKETNLVISGSSDKVIYLAEKRWGHVPLALALATPSPDTLWLEPGNDLHKTSIKIPSSCFTDINSLLKGLNDAFIASFNEIVGPHEPYGTLSLWFAKLVNGRICIGYHAVGYDRWGKICPQNGIGQLYTGVWGYILGDELTKIFGFDGDYGTWIDVMSDSHIGAGATSQEWWIVYQAEFAKYTNPTHYHEYIITGAEKYTPIQKIATTEPPTFGFCPGSSKHIPTKSSVDMEEFPSDNSPFLVYLPAAPERVIFHATWTSATAIGLLSPATDCTAPIGRAVPIGSEVYSASADDESTEHVVRQAWKPICEHETEYAFGIYTKEKGLEHLILQILTSTGTKNYNGNWDIAPKGWGGSIPLSYIDTASFEKLRDIYGNAAMTREYIFTESFNLKEFLEAEALTLGFLVIMKNGRITAVPRTEPTINNATEITETNRIANGSVVWQSSPEGTTNAITVKMDFDIGEDDFRWTDEFHNVASQSDTKNIQSVEIENKGIRSKNWKTATATINEIKMLLQDRLDDWSTESYIYEAEINRSLDSLTIGDAVLITDEKVPNPLTGTRGINQHPGVVEAITFDDATGIGTLRARLRYGSLSELATAEVLGAGISPDAKFWNSGTLAPTWGIPADANGATFIVDQTVYQKNTSIQDPTEGDMVCVVTPATGEMYDRVVVAYDATTGEITLNQPIGSGDDERIIQTQSYEKVSEDTTTGTELKHTYISDTYGVLATKKGFILS